MRITWSVRLNWVCMPHLITWGRKQPLFEVLYRFWNTAVQPLFNDCCYQHSVPLNAISWQSCVGQDLFTNSVLRSQCSWLHLKASASGAEMKMWQQFLVFVVSLGSLHHMQVGPGIIKSWLHCRMMDRNTNSTAFCIVWENDRISVPLVSLIVNTVMPFLSGDEINSLIVTDRACAIFIFNISHNHFVMCRIRFRSFARTHWKRGVVKPWILANQISMQQT